MSSAEMTAAPLSRNMLSTVVLPHPIPPVSPTRRITARTRHLNIGPRKLAVPGARKPIQPTLRTSPSGLGFLRRVSGLVRQRLVLARRFLSGHILHGFLLNRLGCIPDNLVHLLDSALFCVARPVT